MTSKWCFSFPSIDDDSCVVSCALVVLHMTENEAAEDDARCTTKKYGTWSCTDRTERRGNKKEMKVTWHSLDRSPSPVDNALDIGIYPFVFGSCMP